MKILKMTYTVYILYSAILNKYYTGYTSKGMEERMHYHLGTHGGYTSRAKDWVVMYTETLEEKKEALILERRIKKRGAKRFLEG